MDTFNRADMKKFLPSDPDIPHMETLLGIGGVESPSAKTCLHFALGKAYLEGGDSDQAFRHFANGNRLKRSMISYDPTNTDTRIDEIIQSFSKEVMRANASKGNTSRKPIFVLGMPRSGTSLVEQVLASHSQIYGAGELLALSNIVDKIQSFPSAIKSASAEAWEQLGILYLKEINSLQAKEPFIVDKMPGNFLYVGLINLMLPNAKIIHCRRDPVDTCLSCYTKLFTAEQNFSYDLKELGQFYNAYQRLMAHWETVVPSTSLLNVAYEDVVEDLEGQAKRMLNFLGLDWEPSCLSFYENQRSVRTASVNQVRQPIYKSSKGKWRQYQSHLGPLIDILGL